MATPCLNDFAILRGLGDGSSGTVHLVRENESGGLYAIKAIPKRRPCGKELRIETVTTERNTLLDLCGNDFILQLRASFHDSRNYYLVTVRDVILKGMALSLLLTFVPGISPCWGSSHLAIGERLAAKCCSVLHGRISTYSFIMIMTSFFLICRTSTLSS